MNKLDCLRKEIDDVDEKLTSLFEKRMHLVSEVADYKKANGIAVLNEGREAEVLEKALRMLNDRSLEEYVRKFFTDLMKTSREYQERRMK